MVEADVSLEEGVLTIRLAADARLTVAELRERIRRQGFAPREARVRVVGSLSKSDGQYALRVGGAGGRYTLDGVEELLARLDDAFGRDVLLEGRIPEDRNGSTPATMTVLSLSEP